MESFNLRPFIVSDQHLFTDVNDYGINYMFYNIKTLYLRQLCGSLVAIINNIFEVIFLKTR